MHESPACACIRSYISDAVGCWSCLMLQSFSPKASQPGAGNPFSPGMLQGDLSGVSSAGAGGLFTNGTGDEGTAAFMDTLFGNGSQPHTPRSSINNSAAAQALFEAAAAVGSPQRGSPLSSSLSNKVRTYMLHFSHLIHTRPQVLMLAGISCGVCIVVNQASPICQAPIRMTSSQQPGPTVNLGSCTCRMPR